MDKSYEIVRENYRDLVQAIINIETDNGNNKTHYQNIYKTKNIKKSIEVELKSYIFELFSNSRKMQLTDYYWSDYSFSKNILSGDNELVLNCLRNFESVCISYFKNNIEVPRENIDENENSENSCDDQENGDDVADTNANDMEEVLKKLLSSNLNFPSKDAPSGADGADPSLEQDLLKEMSSSGMFSFIESMCDNLRSTEKSVKTECNKDEHFEFTEECKSKESSDAGSRKDAEDSEAIEFPEEIVKLAQELSSEIKIPELFKDMAGQENISDADIPKKIFEKMSTPGGQEVFMNLMKQTGEKIQSKIKSGEINEAKIRSSAQDCLKTFMKKNKDLQNIFGQNFDGASSAFSGGENPFSNAGAGNFADPGLNIASMFSNLSNCLNNTNKHDNHVNETKMRLQKKLKNKKKMEQKMEQKDRANTSSSK